MDQKKTDKNSESQEKDSGGRLKSFKLIDERIQKRRRKASIGRLISLIIALIVIIILWMWARRVAM